MSLCHERALPTQQVGAERLTDGGVSPGPLRLQGSPDHLCCGSLDPEGFL